MVSSCFKRCTAGGHFGSLRRDVPPYDLEKSTNVGPSAGNVDEGLCDRKCLTNPKEQRGYNHHLTMLLACSTSGNPVRSVRQPPHCCHTRLQSWRPDLRSRPVPNHEHRYECVHHRAINIDRPSSKENDVPTRAMTSFSGPEDVLAMK